MILVDTNIWLERLLDQKKAEEVQEFLDTVSPEHLYVSDFSFHSIGVIMTKLNKNNDFLKFIDDIFVNGGIHLLSLNAMETKVVIALMNKKKLDFDDAYQAVIAENYKMKLVSFDKDFSKAKIQVYTPEEALIFYRHSGF
jgi:predicted nucleic acid-binding protein